MAPYIMKEDLTIKTASLLSNGFLICTGYNLNVQDEMNILPRCFVPARRCETTKEATTRGLSFLLPLYVI
jgi:hypothetical protein